MYQSKPKNIIKNIIRTSAYLLICTFILSCAQVVAPGGGPIDRTPPKVLKYTPDSAKLNFTARSIEINFDEYIQLKDLNNQLIVSPPLEHTPDITVKNKTLFIELDKKETLKPNTTYCISFGSALQDFNENNPKENFKYIFSTGNFIDSLIVKGKVQNAFDHKTEKGILVMLYSNMNDSAVYKNKPDYFAKTKADGSFQINNVKDGKYRIIALKDGNANYKYDGENENIGFINAPITVSEKKNILIDLFQESPKKVYLKKYSYDQYGKIVFVFNQGSDSIKVTPLNTDLPTNEVILDYSKNKDTLTYWIKKFEKDSLKLQIRNGNKILDTVEFKTIKKEEALKSKKNPLKLRLMNNFNGNQNFDLNKKIVFSFSQPLVTINPLAKVFLKEDSILLQHLAFKIDSLWAGNGALITLWDLTMKVEDPDHPGKWFDAPMESSIIGLKENTKYHLLILPGTFTDIFGLTNDSIKIDFKTREEKFYGSIALKINIPATKNSYIVQLLDDRDNVLDETFITKSETLPYNHLYPKNYKLKIIYDENNNDKWDSGDYLKKQQPEKVIYYKELINVRSNWDLDLDWKVTNNE